MVRSLDLLCQWHLAADTSDRFSAGKSVSFLEARDLCFAIGGDHDDFVDAFVYAGFEEKGHFVDDHSTGFAFSDPTHEPLLLAGDAGMDNAFELSAFRPIAEDDAPEGLAVERAVLVEDSLSK